MNPREISTTSTPGCLPQPEGRADPLGQIVHLGDIMSAVQYLLNADTPDATLTPLTSIFLDRQYPERPRDQMPSPATAAS